MMPTSCVRVQKASRTPYGAWIEIRVCPLITKKLKEKSQATLAHIHALTQQEEGEYAARNPEGIPTRLEEAAVMLEGKVEEVTDPIAEASTSQEQKTYAKERSVFTNARIALIVRSRQDV